MALEHLDRKKKLEGRKKDHKMQIELYKYQNQFQNIMNKEESKWTNEEYTVAIRYKVLYMEFNKGTKKVIGAIGKKKSKLQEQWAKLQSVKTSNIPDPGELQQEDIPYMMGIDETILGRAKQIQADRMWENNIQLFPTSVLRTLKERLHKKLGSTSDSSANLPPDNFHAPAPLLLEATESHDDSDELKTEVDL